MTKKTVGAGATVNLKPQDGKKELSVESVQGDVRFSPQKKRVGQGKKLKEGSTVEVRLQNKESFYVYNPNNSEATLEVNE